MTLQTILQVGWPSMVARVVSNRVPHLLRPSLFISLAKSNHFTYVWAVENVNIFYRRPVVSPAVIVPSLNRRCCIELCLQDKDDPGLMYFKLLRKFRDGSVKEVKGMEYELSILAPDGSCLIKREFFSSRDKIQHRVSMSRNKVLVQRKSAFLPNNILTLQCKICLSNEVRCFARTRLKIEKVSLPFLIKDFLSSNESLKCTEVVRSTFFVNSVIHTEIFCSSCCEERIKVNLRSGRDYNNYDSSLDESDSDGDESDSDGDEKDSDGDEKDYDGDKSDSDGDKSDSDGDNDEINSYKDHDPIDCYTFKMSLTGAFGKEVCILDETRFNFRRFDPLLHAPETISLPLTRNMLMKESSKYLKNGALSLNCHFTFYSDALMNEVTCTNYGNSDLPEYSSMFFNADKDESASTFRDDLWSLYENRILSDFTIQTETKLFSVHKSILISRSPIFRSMIVNCVKRDLYVSDVDSETMHRFLLYLYTDRVEDMDWEGALRLYVVAEQFKIPILMKKCSLVMTEKLTLKNVCDILLLAYKYHDEGMKSSIRDFISLHDATIFNSDEWIKMEETNSRIAAETLRLTYFEKVNKII